MGVSANPTSKPVPVDGTTGPRSAPGARFAAGAVVIQSHLATVPGGAGVYRMIRCRGATSSTWARPRASGSGCPSYTNLARLSVRLRRMVAETASMEFVTTHTEAEALLLEANLIKALLAALQHLAARRQVVPVDPSYRRPSISADPQASRGAPPQGRVFRPLRLGLGGQRDPDGPAARLPSPLVLGFDFRRGAPGRAFFIRSSAAARPASAASRRASTRPWSIRRAPSWPAAAGTSSAGWRGAWKTPAGPWPSNRRPSTATASGP